MTEIDVTSPEVTGSNPDVTSFDRKSPGIDCRRPKTGVYCTFHFMAVASRRRQSRDGK